MTKKWRLGTWRQEERGRNEPKDLDARKEKPK